MLELLVVSNSWTLLLPFPLLCCRVGHFARRPLHCSGKHLGQRLLRTLDDAIVVGLEMPLQPSEDMGMEVMHDHSLLDGIGMVKDLQMVSRLDSSSEESALSQGTLPSEDMSRYGVFCGEEGSDPDAIGLVRGQGTARLGQKQTHAFVCLCQSRTHVICCVKGSG